MAIYVKKCFEFNIFFFSCFNRDFNIYIDFTHIAASTQQLIRHKLGHT